MTCFAFCCSTLNLFKYQDGGCVGVNLSAQALRGWLQDAWPRITQKKEKEKEKKNRQAGCWRLALAESRSYIHQRPLPRIAHYSLISTRSPSQDIHTSRDRRGESGNGEMEELTEKTDINRGNKTIQMAKKGQGVK